MSSWIIILSMDVSFLSPKRGRYIKNVKITVCQKTKKKKKDSLTWTWEITSYERVPLGLHRTTFTWIQPGWLEEYGKSLLTDIDGSLCTADSGLGLSDEWSRCRTPTLLLLSFFPYSGFPKLIWKNNIYIYKQRERKRNV